MRTLTNLIGTAILAVGLLWANDDKQSRMVLKVEKDQVALAQKALSSVKGVKQVKYDEANGQLVVLYDKPTMGCCSRIHKALQEAGVKYTLVSNEEYPACKGKEHSHEHSEAGTPATLVKHKGKKCCCKECKSQKGCEGDCKHKKNCCKEKAKADCKGA